MPLENSCNCRQGDASGMRHLFFFDGKSFNPLDFTLQAEKPLKKARHRKEQYKKLRNPKSSGANVSRCLRNRERKRGLMIDTH
ncbi:hypothetical protein [Desulfosporosinus nitroreducens]|uniref:hypothetical protein n=1 Tax=Desulfosporosinus nitroreducens TaxID=2018668 RepID=UPI00207CED67|nr:hypothetical protein [Desulfosporosinus nitroreducens]MCO1603897.1 hypothetical protein [Desulfosporosinus nitroreducens]